MGLSKRGYARHRAELGLKGTTHQAVSKAIETGRISTEPDGTIDPDKADAQWKSNTDPSHQDSAGNQKVATGNREAPVRTEDDAREAVNLIARVLAEEGQTGLNGFDAARTAETILKVHERDLGLAKARGELIDRSKAEQIAFSFSRAARDALLQWPARVAAIMASELKVDPHQMETVLDKHVREHLADVADRPIKLV